MRTPYGKECPYFFGDYFRGRSREECRLVEAGPTPGEWNRKLCQNCPLPGIFLANACPDMHLTGAVERQWFGLVRNIKISAYCDRTNSVVKDPYVGCGSCHPIPAIFETKEG